MSVNINIVKGIEAHTIQKARQNNRDYTYFHASAWDGCHRKIAYQYYEAKGFITVDEKAQRITAQGERIFDNGHYMHFRYRDYLQDYATEALLGCWLCLNWTAHPEPKIYGRDSKLGITKPEKCECGSTRFQYEEVGFFDSDLWVGGHVDAVIDATKWPYTKSGEHKSLDAIPEDERYFIVDFKTMHPFIFKDLQKPKPEHITQMQWYLHLSGMRYGKFLYENKADQRVKEFLVERDEATIAIKKEEAVLLKYQLEHLNSDGKRVLPERGHDSRGHKECLECKFKGHCWKGIE